MCGRRRFLKVHFALQGGAFNAFMNFTGEKNSIAEKLCCVCMTIFFRQFNAMNEINEIRVIKHHDLQTTTF